MGVERKTSYFLSGNSHNRNSCFPAESSQCANNFISFSHFRNSLTAFGQNRNSCSVSRSSQNKKGQVFVAGAVLILVLIAILVMGFRYSNPEYEKFLGKRIENMDRQIRFASISNESSLMEFYRFLQADLHGFKGIYMTADYKSGLVRVSAGNFLGSRTSMRLESSQFSGTMELNNNQTASLEFPAAGQIGLNITYYLDSEENKESFIIAEGRTTFADFMIDSRDLARKKVIYYTAQ